MAGDSFDFSRLGAPTWGLDELADYIVDRHHRYVQGAIPAVRAALSLAVDRWGRAHPPVAAVQALFDELADELESHMAKEEHILFPAIRDLANARRQPGRGRGPFGTLLHPIRAMENEHAHATRLLEDIRRETNEYHPPPAADEAGHDCYRQLARFEADLHEHIHLENEVLFPRSLDLEQHVA